MKALKLYGLIINMIIKIQKKKNVPYLLVRPRNTKIVKTQFFNPHWTAAHAAQIHVHTQFQNSNSHNLNIISESFHNCQVYLFFFLNERYTWTVKVFKAVTKLIHSSYILFTRMTLNPFLGDNKLSFYTQQYHQWPVSLAFSTKEWIRRRDNTEDTYRFSNGIKK